MGMLVKQVMWASASCSGILLAGPTAMAADTILAALLGRGRRWDRLENSTQLHLGQPLGTAARRGPGRGAGPMPTRNGIVVCMVMRERDSEDGRGMHRTALALARHSRHGTARPAWRRISLARARHSRHGMTRHGSARHGPVRTLGWRLGTATRPRTDETAARDGGMTQHGTAQHDMAARLDRAGTALHCAVLALHRTTPHRTAAHHTPQHWHWHGTAGTARQSRHDTARHGTAQHGTYMARHGGTACRCCLRETGNGPPPPRRCRRAAAAAPPHSSSSVTALLPSAELPPPALELGPHAEQGRRGDTEWNAGWPSGSQPMVHAPTSLSRPPRARRAQAAAAPAHSK
jgi:hypothetical protein